MTIRSKPDPSVTSFSKLFNSAILAWIDRRCSSVYSDGSIMLRLIDKVHGVDTLQVDFEKILRRVRVHRASTQAGVDDDGTEFLFHGLHDDVPWVVVLRKPVFEVCLADAEGVVVLADMDMHRFHPARVRDDVHRSGGGLHLALVDDVRDQGVASAVLVDEAT